MRIVSPFRFVVHRVLQSRVAMIAVVMLLAGGAFFLCTLAEPPAARAAQQPAHEAGPVLSGAEG